MRKLVKFLTFGLLSSILSLLSSRKKKHPNKWDGILIPFAYPIGIGDLLMLSPVINIIAEKNKDTSLVIQTHLPNFIHFPKNVRVLPTFTTKNQKNWLCLSLLMNLKHCGGIRKTGYYLGYFLNTRATSNYKNSLASYDGQINHFLKRGVSLLESFSPKEFIELKYSYDKSSVQYPAIKMDPYPFFKGGKTLALGLFSQFDHSLWNLDAAIEVIESLYENKRFDQFLILGDSSKRNKKMAEYLIEKSNIPSQKLQNLCGKTSLPQAAYCISESNAFLGVDSGLSHFAFQLSPRVYTIFIITRPENIIPRNKEIESRIYPIHGYEENEVQLFDGLNPVDFQKAEIMKNRISAGKVLAIINESYSFS